MKQKPKTLKTISARILLLLLLLFGVYAAVDQIIFQFRKAEYVAAAKQYARENAAVNTISPEKWRQGTDAVLADQKERIRLLNQKYAEPEDSNRSGLYLDSLEERVKSGWKWGDCQIEDITMVSAWKSPLEWAAHVTLSYSVTVPAVTGGIVYYINSSAFAKCFMDQGQKVFQEYWRNDYSVLKADGYQIHCTGSSSSNQKSFLYGSSSPASH